MKQNKKSLILKVLILVLIIAIVGVVITVTANTAESQDEQTLVKMSALISKGADSSSKVSISALTENLEKYVGSEKVSVTEKSADTLLVTFLESGREYEVDVNIGVSGGNSGGSGSGTDLLPSTTETTPYMPSGFHYVEGDLDTGLVIADSSGNEYVWVEVPRNTTVYSTAGLNVTSFTDTEYEAIETDLQEYTSVYRNSTTFSDIHSGDDTSTGLTETAYNTLKQKMLKSVYQNGGFYVGRYETGIASTSRDYDYVLYTEEELQITETPVIQANAYPYNWVRCSQAQTLASGMESGEYNTSLMFGVQWDLILKYLETKGAATQSELNENSTSWGNVLNNTYSIADSSVKYNVMDTSTALMPEWLPATSYTKPADTEYTLLTTGASSTFKKQNIYNIAGNVAEWTLEYTSNASRLCANRGGSFIGNAEASYRDYDFGDSTYSLVVVGFRVSLY